SGLDTRSIFFGGFLPNRQSERQKRLSQVQDIPATLVFYETPHRLVRALEDAAAVLGDRRAAVARELTKMHEEVQRGTLISLKKHFEANANLRGEFVLVIDEEPAKRVITQNEQLLSRLKELEDEGIERRAALKTAARELGMTRSEAYRITARRG
ncbi:MAG: 16S rRNA (cytidine(1402)-2'-O)-methyltransferase, partial [Blastocatellia bacterium]|nr:16S rRNA (cytidine(1402)-2'-O)-methyltransferase [Blastocatellia bacterium]